MFVNRPHDFSPVQAVRDNNPLPGVARRVVVVGRLCYHNLRHDLFPPFGLSNLHRAPCPQQVAGLGAYLESFLVADNPSARFLYYIKIYQPRIAPDAAQILRCATVLDASLGDAAMLVPKEVIRPGTYWYRDEATGAPRKLVVTPELTRYWHDQGNAMLATGLTVPVPCEHDFSAHPMTPADKLKNNAGWVKRYDMRGDRLFATVDVQDEELARKLPRTVRFTSPWINSFTDGKGKGWSNVISHLALTTRPRIVEQQPFGSVAAALSVAQETKLVSVSSATGAGGFCLSRAGLLLGDLPAYPVAFSLYSGAPLAIEHDKATGRFTGVHQKHADTIRSKSQAKSPSRGAMRLSSTAHYHEKQGNMELAKDWHKAAAASHIAASKHYGHSNHSLSNAHKELADYHNGKSGSAAFSYPAGPNKTAQIHAIWAKYPHADDYENRHDREYEFDKRGPEGKSKGDKLKKTGRRRKKKRGGGKPFSVVLAEGRALPGKAKPGDDDGYDYEDDGDQPEEGAEYEYEYEPDDEDEDEGSEPDGSGVVPDEDGDVGMEELLCDLLQALGVPMPDESNEAEFKRHLYEAAMSKIKDLTSKGMSKGEGDKDKVNGRPDQNQPPGQNKHTSQPNPLIQQVQQEQQPMYMGLNGGSTVQLSIEDINKIEDSTMRTVALAMYTENENLRKQLDANARATNALRAAELEKETKKRQQRISMLSRLSPKVREDLEAMAGLQGMALSMGDDGRIVDPMRQTLDMLEKGLANMPQLLTADHSALSVVPQPRDTDALTEERVEEIADSMARQMGCAPEKRAS